MFENDGLALNKEVSILDLGALVIHVSRNQEQKKWYRRSVYRMSISGLRRMSIQRERASWDD